MKKVKVLIEDIKSIASIKAKNTEISHLFSNIMSTKYIINTSSKKRRITVSICLVCSVRVGGGEHGLINKTIHQKNTH